MATFNGSDRGERIVGTAEADTIFGLGGFDTLIGGGGDDTIDGGRDDDFINGDAGNDLLQGQDGLDNLRGGIGDDALFGGAEADFLLGDAGDDIIRGEDGDDLLRGGVGIDSYDGGDGFDRISFLENGTTQGVIANLRTGRIANDGHGNTERMVGVEALGVGTVFRDVFVGDDAANALFGGQGDVLLGDAGDDQILIGGIVGTWVDGGDGRDSLFVADSDLRADETGRPVIVEADTRVIVDLARQLIVDDGFGARGRVRSIEDVVAAGLDDLLLGDDAANALSGGGGVDRLNGRGGDDRIVGGTGADRLSGGDGGDVFAFAGFAFAGFGFAPGANVSTPIFAPGDSGRTNAEFDRIFDFERGDASAGRGGDTIDLSAVDAVRGNTVGGEFIDDAFTWLGTGAFSGAAGEARYEIRRGSTFVFLEVDGERGADMVILLVGEIPLTATDFVF